MRKHFAHLVLALACVFATNAAADGTRRTPEPDVAAAPVRAAPIQPAPTEAAPVGQSGQITLRDGEVVMNVPTGYLFYPAPVARDFMARHGASAPAGETLGLLAPASTDVRAADAWATVVSYDEIGYVQAETASGLGDANLEADVRAARDAQGRRFEGFAVQPAFEAAAPNVVWAERTAPPASQGRDFRHEQKLMGRKGALGLTSIGSADQMPAIQIAAPEMAAMFSFRQGDRHADFQPANDQVSQYSVPGLVTGVPTPPPQALADAQKQGQTGFGGLSGYFPWIAFGVVFLAIAGYMMMRRRRDDNLIPEE